jgi:hypothetical protein
LCISRIQFCECISIFSPVYLWTFSLIDVAFFAVLPNVEDTIKYVIVRIISVIILIIVIIVIIINYCSYFDHRCYYRRYTYIRYFYCSREFQLTAIQFRSNQHYACLHFINTTKLFFFHLEVITVKIFKCVI